MQPRGHFAVLNAPEDASRIRSETLEPSPFETRFSPDDLDITARTAEVYKDEFYEVQLNKKKTVIKFIIIQLIFDVSSILYSNNQFPVI